MLNTVNKKTIAHLAVAAAVLFAAAAALTALFAEHGLSRLVPGGLGVAFSTRIYSAPYEIKRGAPAAWPGLLSRLKRLGYRRAQPPQSPGEYSWAPPLLDIYLRGFQTPPARHEPLLASLSAENGLWEIRSSSGEVLGRVMLEPELAEEISGPNKVRRDPSALDEIPVPLQNAVIAVEDKRFKKHFGIDPKALIHALWDTLTLRGLRGGSTITQQLAKNLFLTPKRTLWRKTAEAALALYLELRYTKDKILTLYLNHIYMGQDGPVSVAGIKAASKFYFGKGPDALDLAECAMLAGLIRSPYIYNPRRAPETAIGRRNHVLSRMFSEGMISADELTAAKAQPLSLAKLAARAENTENSYYTSEVIRRLLLLYDEDEVFRSGLSVYTAMDPQLQAAASRSARLGRYEAAVTAMDAVSGNVLALAGGRDYLKSQFNRATQARRQPGSAFKPFVYGTAIEEGFTPATLLNDSAKSYRNPDGGSWDPRNYDGVYNGTVTLRSAIARSLNSATLDLAGRLGADKITAFAERMGIESPLENSLAVALGASEVTLLELTAAYAPFANGGFRVTPVIISAVCDSRGKVIEYAERKREPVITPAQAYLMTSLLESVVSEGTAAGVLGQIYGWSGRAAGKTGTTNKGRDAWFIGYTPRLLAGVWTGDDSNKAIGAIGAGDAAPLWSAFMKEALDGAQAENFAKPEEGLVSVSIDPVNGLLAVAGCPEQKKEIFISGTQPKTKCPLHSRGLAGWFKRLFGIR